MVKLHLVAIAVPVGVVILGLGGWSYVQNTPQYSVYEIDKSIKDRDFSSFQKYVDMNTTYDNLAGDVTGNLKQTLSQKDCTKIENALNCALLQAIIKKAPQLSEQTKAKDIAEIKARIEGGNIYDNSFHVDNLAADMTQIKFTYNQGIATTTLYSDKYGQLVVKLKMQNGVWRVVDAVPDTKAIQIFSGQPQNFK